MGILVLVLTASLARDSAVWLIEELHLLGQGLVGDLLEVGEEFARAGADLFSLSHPPACVVHTRRLHVINYNFNFISGTLTN